MSKMWEVNVLITLFEWNVLLNMGKGVWANCHFSADIHS